VVQVGQSMENPVSGERFVWRATASSTGGEYCEFDLFLAPGARIAAAHRHPSQLETFSVLRPAARAIAVIGRAAGFRPDGTRAVRAR